MAVDMTEETIEEGHPQDSHSVPVENEHQHTKTELPLKRSTTDTDQPSSKRVPRSKGIAQIKEQYRKPEGQGRTEGSRGKGQNTNRKFVQPRDSVKFCDQLKDGLGNCSYGENCKWEHDVDRYLACKAPDLDGKCPVFSAIGFCTSGLKCRWLSSHWDSESKLLIGKPTTPPDLNRVSAQQLGDLQRRKFAFPKSDSVIKWLDADTKRAQGTSESSESKTELQTGSETQPEAPANVEPPIPPCEKKKLYYARAKVLSPLTTVGNLPYRRLMKSLGAEVTFGEMALTLPLLQGSKSEWALARCDASEVSGNSQFGVQVTTAKHWQAVRAAEVISILAPHTSEINLNCGCPIDLVYRQGAGSALMDNPARVARIVRGMNAVSGEIPVTLKLRTGVRDNHPTAHNLISRLMGEGHVAAFTLHGRSRAQRYTRDADWDYVARVAKQISSQREEMDDNLIDKRGWVKPWILGNGDCYSFLDWHHALDTCSVDSVMVARGALIKPWIFEEIDAKQYLDKSASERLEYIKQYCGLGLQHWGSDEYGINVTRRYVCEFLSFFHRYVPVGVLEYLPPKINDRPEPWVGRSDLETLLASSDAQDWIRISEMFLGPVSPSFDFTPKHKSNSYEG